MSQRKPGYGAKIKDTLTGAQKRKPAAALRAYRDNFPFLSDREQEIIVSQSQRKAEGDFAALLMRNA